MKMILAPMLLLLAASLPVAADNGLVTRPSRHAVAETIDRFEAAVRQDKFQVFARVDFQAIAQSQGAQVKPSQILIFGRGGLLPPLLPVVPKVAIDLPLKVLAWEDGEGKVWLTWNTGEFLKERHAIAGKDDLLKRLTGLMEAYAGKATE